MISNNNQVHKKPSEKEINFILELFNLKKFDDAKKEIAKHMKKYPNSHVLFNILGAVLAEQNKLNDAAENYKKAIKINPDYAQAYNNLGICLHKLDKAEEAINNYKKAISIKSDFAEAFNNLGSVIHSLNKPKTALPYFEKALKLKANYAEALNNLGAAYQDLGDKKKALENFYKAVKVKPNYAEVYNHIGLVLSDLSQFDESLLNYRKAIQLKPDYEKSYNNLGNLLNNLGKFEEATNVYHKAIQIKPDYAKAYSNLLFNLNYKINLDQNLYLSEAKKYRLNCKSIKKEINFSYQYVKKPKKIRLGVVSADFGNHPGGFFSLSTFKELRKKNFELVAYATTDRKDELSPQFKATFLEWRMVENKKDQEIVEQIFKDKIHILMDHQGHSAKNKLPIFMYKPAPIQISWLGQGSTGIHEIDYFVGSPHVTPKNEETHFVEKIWRLPEISQCFTPPNFDIKINSLPALKNNFITFGCLNKLSKVNSEVIALWSKILLSIPNSRLILKNKDLDDHKIVQNTLEKFKRYKVNKDRLILSGKTETRKELLEVYNNIDIALDPFPFQGNTSTCEAVWMGVPVLTLKGNRYLFHFGESINSNLNMHDWIASNHNEYVSKAINFSSNIDKLSKIRTNLRDIALKSPVFDAQRFAEHFNKMLWGMWKKFNIQN